MLRRLSTNLSLRTNMRIARLQGKSGLSGSSVNESAHNQKTGEHNNQLVHGDVALRTGSNIQDGTQLDLAENEHPGMPRINRWLSGIEQRLARMRRRITFFKKLMDKTIPWSDRWLMWQLQRDLTPLEKIEQDDIRRREHENAVHLEDAHRAEILLRNALANIGFSDVQMLDGKRQFRSLVEFDVVLYSPLAYYYHVDAEHLPYGTSTFDMHNDRVCTHLSAAVRHPVDARINQIGGRITGLWYIIQIAATGGIPTNCDFSDLLQRVSESQPPLAYPVGLGRNGRPIIRDLSSMPHLLITGETGGGKSNAVNVIVSTFVARNKPDTIRIALMDLKNGMEMIHYEGIPHLLGKDDGLVDVPNGIAENANEAINIMRFIAAENHERQRKFREAKIKSLSEWNRRHRTRKLPYIVVFIDELAILMDDPDLKKELNHILQSLVSTSRASGICMVASTQRADKTVINGTIKVNFPGRLCFQVPDIDASILAIGKSDAANLPNVGRAIHKHGRDYEQVQTPLIDSKYIQAIVRNATAGRTTSKLASQQITPDEIVKLSISLWNGNMAIRTIWNYLQLNGRPIEYAALNSILSSMEGTLINIDGRDYKVMAGAGRLPRRLELQTSPNIDPA